MQWKTKNKTVDNISNWDLSEIEFQTSKRVKEDLCISTDNLDKAESSSIIGILRHPKSNYNSPIAEFNRRFKWNPLVEAREFDRKSDNIRLLRKSRELNIQEIETNHSNLNISDPIQLIEIKEPQVNLNSSKFSMMRKYK